MRARMISRGGRGSRGRAIEPKTCSNPANGFPGTALMPCVDAFFAARRAVTFLGLARVAVGMKETVFASAAVTSRQKRMLLARRQSRLATQSANRSDHGGDGPLDFLGCRADPYRELGRAGGGRVGEPALRQTGKTHGARTGEVVTAVARLAGSRRTTVAAWAAISPGSRAM
jgi:hypothetical protein